MSINVKITKSRVAAAVAAGVLLAPATALASHVFDDVPDGAFYANPVEWAFENDITTGKSPTSFAPLDGVTRGESVTFLQRYNDNVVEPALDEVDAVTLEGREAEDLIRAAGTRDETAVNDWDGLAEVTSRTITAPTNGYLVVNYTVTVTKDTNETANGEMLLASVLNLDGNTVAETNGGIDFDESWQSNFNTMTINTVVPVVAGAHTLDGVIARQGSVPAGALMYIYDQSITAIFVPFDANGLGPV